MTAGAPVGARTAGWVVLAQRLYAQYAAGVVGARSWADLPPEVRLRWFQRAEGFDAGRRRYEREWGDLPGAPGWDDLRPVTREAWIRDAIRFPGRVR